MLLISHAGFLPFCFTVFWKGEKKKKKERRTCDLICLVLKDLSWPKGPEAVKRFPAINKMNKYKMKTSLIENIKLLGLTRGGSGHRV